MRLKKVSKRLKKLPRPPIGMRTIKTGLAVSLTLLVAQTGWLDTPIYAVIGTILAMQSTIGQSLTEGKHRILGTILGGLIGFGLAHFQPLTPLLAGAAVILTIYACNQLRLNHSVSITLTVALSILIDTSLQHPFTYSAWRTWDTLVGVLIGLAINSFVCPPKHSRSFHESFRQFQTLALAWLQAPMSDLEPIRSLLKECEAHTSCYTETRPPT